MKPALEPLDRLVIESYGANKVNVGDVIVFLRPKSNELFAHRVSAIRDGEIVTQADQDPSVDEHVLTADEVVGRVVCVERNNVRVRVDNGARGVLHANIVRAKRTIMSLMSRALHVPYYWSAGSRMLARLPGCQMSPLIVRYQREGGAEMQLLIGKRVIGRLCPDKDHWEISIPFRLFIDETSLPR